MSILRQLFFGVVATLAFPLVLFLALFSSKLRSSICERLLGGDWLGINLNQSIWIHAASVGELQGVVPFVEKLKTESDVPIIVTTTSITGKEKAAAIADRALLIPYDHPLLIAFAIKKLKPRLFLLFETEIWPNLLLQLESNKVPVVLINGRISDRTFPNYLRIRFLIEPLLRILSACFVQSEKDQLRFKELGAKKIKIIGNTKYDLEIKDLTEEAQKLRQALICSPEIELLVCGSVRPGESQIILKAYKKLQESFPNLKLLVAPRHPEQFQTEAELIANSGFKISKRSAPVSGADVFLLDSLGELKIAYAASTVSFIGGSLVNIGGHNPLEPAAFKKPVLFGPYTQNVEELSNELVEVGGALRVNNEGDFVEIIKRLLGDKDYQASVGIQALKVASNHRGAVSRVLEEISPLLDSSIPDFLNADLLVATVLKPAEFTYSLVTSLRNYFYDTGILKAYRSSLPVICVGNITVGGNAKSPVTQSIVRELIKKNKRPVILLRGYAGSEIGPIKVKDSTQALRFGDEACMHKLELPDVPVIVSRNRVAGAKYIEQAKLGDIIVLDDGFQHRALARDINLLLFDKTSIEQASDGKLLPAGRLRERLVPALRRADAVCVIERGEKVAAPDWIPSHKPVFNLSLEFTELVFLNSDRKISWKELHGKSVSMIASIAKPESFKRMIEGQGIQVLQSIFKPDHFVWSERDLAEIEKLPGEFVLTTKKDSVKLGGVVGKKKEIERVLVAGIEVTLPERLLSWF